MTLYLIAIAISILIYLLLAASLSLQFGFTGIINFGIVGFFAIGAYTSALLSQQGLPLPLTFLSAMLLAALLAYPLGVVALRLSGDYLAIVTLGFSETIRMFLLSEEWLTNGSRGMPGLNPLATNWFGPGSAQLTILALLLVANILVFLVIRYIIGSPFGRIIGAVRDDEIAVRALGKSPSLYKTKVLVLGAAIAGLAGAFQAHYIGFIVPEQFVPLITIYIWIAIILGGSSRLLGAVAGTIVLITFFEGSRFARDFFIGISEPQLASLRIWIIGMALILTLLYRPDGIFPAKTKR